MAFAVVLLWSAEAQVAAHSKRVPAALWGYEAVVEREHDRRWSIADIELGEDVADVTLHRRLADEQRARDVAVARASAEQLQDLALAGRELFEARGCLTVGDGCR